MKISPTCFKFLWGRNVITKAQDYGSESAIKSLTIFIVLYLRTQASIYTRIISTHKVLHMEFLTSVL